MHVCIYAHKGVGYKDVNACRFMHICRVILAMVLTVVSLGCYGSEVTGEWNEVTITHNPQCASKHIAVLEWTLTSIMSKLLQTPIVLLHWVTWMMSSNQVKLELL